jgi:hypothetical protein
MGNTQRITSMCNVKIGSFKDVTGHFKDELGADLVVFEIDGSDKCPRFTVFTTISGDTEFKLMNG